jgi:uncharacterized membrane protein
MKNILKFLKTTLLGGVFFLLPLILIFLVFGKAFRALSKIVDPFAKALPYQSFLGVQKAYLVAIIILIAVGFFAGLLAKTVFGGRVRKWLEDLLDKIPGYSLFRVFSKDMEAGEGVTRRPVGLVGLGNDNWQWCFIIERHVSGYMTIFIPGSPKPTSGAVRFLPAGLVKEVDIPMTLMIKCLTQNGAGSLDLLEGFLKPKKEGPL